MELDIDITDIKEEDIENVNSFDPIPEGQYTLKADEWKLKISKNENEYITVTFSVVSDSYHGRKIWQNYAIGAKQGKFARTLVKAWALSVGQNINRINQSSLDALTGKSFEAKVGIETSEGYQPKNKINEFIIPRTETLSKSSEVNDPFDVPF